jgi:hypothetical protein
MQPGQGTKSARGPRGARGSQGKRGKRRGGKKKRPSRGPSTGPPRRRPHSFCVCTSCGAKVPLYTEVPCYVMNCPKCGMGMVKEGTGKAPVDDETQPPNI